MKKGGVLVEFALILPLMIIIAVSGFEFTRALRFLKISADLSKEIAKITLRECFDATTTNLHQICLETNRERLENFANTIVPGVELIITYSEFNPAITDWNPPVIAIGERAPTDPIDFNRQTSRFQNFMNTFGGTLTLHQKIYFGECFVPYQPIFTFLEAVLPFNTQNGFLYDATVI